LKPQGQLFDSCRGDLSLRLTEAVKLAITLLGGGVCFDAGVGLCLCATNGIVTNWLMITRLQTRSRLLAFFSRTGANLGLVLIVGACAAATPPPAGDFLMHNWDLEDGLPSAAINAVARTHDGYVWLGTQRGLVRFDGVHFLTFNPETTVELKGDRVASLTVDQQGVLWIGQAEGTLTKLEKGRFTTVDLGKAGYVRRINSMVTDSGGNLWLATAGAGLIRFKNGQTESFTTNGLPALNILKVLADPRGRILYLTAPGQLGWIEAERCHEEKSAAPAGLIRVMALAQDGGLWLAAQQDKNSGVRIYKFKAGQLTEEKQSYPWPDTPWKDPGKERQGALLEDQAGNLWCGTPGAGVYYRPIGGHWQQLKADLSFSQAETLCLAADEHSSIWIGTRTSGLRQAVPQPLNIFTLPKPANADHLNELLTVCVRHDGSIWGGTDGIGIFRWRDFGTNHVGEPQGLDGMLINTIFEDSHSNLWAGTSTGLFRYQDGHFTFVETGTGDATVDALYEDPQRKLWAGTTKGLVCLNDPKQAQLNQSNGLPPGRIFAITRDAAGRFWVAVSGRGVFWQKQDRFELSAPTNGTAEARRGWGSGVKVCSLVPDTDGSVWIATYGDGLFRLAGDQIRQWTWEKDGIPSNLQFAMMADGVGNLWIGSENGIYGYGKQSLLDSQAGNRKPFRWQLTVADGLPYKVFSGGSQPTAARSADGRLWFPNGPGLVGFDPSSIVRHPQTWPPVIEEVRVDGQPTPFNQTESIQMVSGVRTIEIFFTSPNIMSPTHLYFRYRLDGLENDWGEAGTRRSAQYNRLPPGEYKFRVSACDNDGVWNVTEAVLRLTVVPRFWETKWFQFGMGLMLLGGAGFAARQIERSRNRRKLAAVEREHALERAAVERERALTQERARIARDIHDDLGASLTEVALLGDMAASSGSPDELHVQTQKISAAAREMSQSLEAIVWAVRPQNDTLRSLVKYLSRRTDELFEKIPRQYQFTAPTELPDLPVHAEVRHNVFLAYKEALTNALKHSRATLVRIEIVCVTEICRIIVTDNGQGFDAGLVQENGSGLKNMRQRMQDIGGGFDLQSQPGHGTTVRMHFSLRRQIEK